MMQRPPERRRRRRAYARADGVWAPTRPGADAMPRMCDVRGRMSPFRPSAAPAQDSEAARARWAWLHDLVGRARTEIPDDGGPRPALADALQGMGFSAHALLEGIAAVLEVPSARLRDPDADTIARVDGARLAVLLPPLLDHHAHDVRRVAQRWVSRPALAYQLPRAVLERWLRGTGTMAALIEPRLVDEGLALLGPAALHRLAVVAQRPGIRNAAHGWVARVEV